MKHLKKFNEKSVFNDCPSKKYLVTVVLDSRSKMVYIDEVIDGTCNPEEDRINLSTQYRYNFQKKEFIAAPFDDEGNQRIFKYNLDRIKKITKYQSDNIEDCKKFILRFVSGRKYAL